MRGGEATSCAVSALVVGDVVELVRGDAAPADGLVLHADGLHVREPAEDGGGSVAKGPYEFVGEAVRRSPFVARHSLVEAGTGRLVVLVVAQPNGVAPIAPAADELRLLGPQRYVALESYVCGAALLAGAGCAPLLLCAAAISPPAPLLPDLPP